MVDLDLRVVRPPLSLRKQVHEVLRGAIVDMQFAPGQRLIERELCEMTGVSRAVIREVLRELEAEGLVSIVPNKGPVVACLIGLKEARGLYETRAVLEALAARVFAQQATDLERHALREAYNELAAAYERQGDSRDLLRAKGRFYAVLLAGAGNETSTAVLRSLHDRISALRAMTMASPNRSIRSLEEIRSIVDAIDVRDPDAAWDASILHVQNAAGVALSVLRRQESTPPDGSMDVIHLPLSSIKSVP